MPPHFKHRRPNNAARVPGLKHKERKAGPVVGFTSSRTQDVEDAAEQFPTDDEDLAEAREDVEDLDGSSSEGEKDTAAHSYASLLQALKPPKAVAERPTKRRKLEYGHSQEQENSFEPVKTPADVFDEATVDDAAAAAQLIEGIEDDVNSKEEEEEDSDDQDFVLHDPFEQHYANMAEADLNSAIAEQASKGIVDKTTIGTGTRKHTTSYGEATSSTASRKTLKNLNLKRKLADVGNAIVDILQNEEADLLREVFGYTDILYGCRDLQNVTQLRDIAALHCLNHIFKTRDRVLKNNAKLASDTTGDAEHRDQGFARPKVLILVPTKQACVRFVDTLIKLSKPDQQENKSRFMDTFYQPEDDTFEYKPADFRDLFGGNHEEDFRVGLKFTRKTIKFFSGFYNSDIILASPLGLMRTITTGGGKKDDKKSYDADFLSSIEVLIMDHANALEMQNWQHVDYVFSQLNLLPKESHGCDFSRARTWYLDGKAKYLRQTIIFSDYLTPNISSLASTHLHNIDGRVKYTPTYTGAMLNLPASISLTLTQSFLRFDSPSHTTDSDSRFQFFTSTILPNLLRSSNKAATKGTLIFVPTYLDFVRLRNHFSTAAETTSLSFGTISEYSTKGDAASARSHFSSRRHSLLLYSERAHHYFRYKLRGVRRLLFYGVPENPVFWTEMIEMVGANAAHDVEWAQSQRAKQGRGLVRALFSKWDVMKLERIVGTERVGRLVREREGDVFDFV